MTVEDEYRKHVERCNRCTDRDIEAAERARRSKAPITEAERDRYASAWNKAMRKSSVMGRSSFLYVPLRWGQLNVKWTKNSLFSERERLVSSITLGPIRLTWRARH